MSTPMTAQTGSRERVVGHGHEAFEWVRARVAALARLDATGLDVPTRVTMLPGDAVAVVEPGHEAPNLQMVLDARGSLRAGECVWVGMAVAEALSVLHREGLAHGAITAASVRLPSSGPLLGNVVDASDTSTAADDVAALGTLLASCVSGPDAERVRAWTEPMTHADPGARPAAAMVARALGSCAHPEPLQHTPRSVASSMRASVAKPGQVRRLPEARWWRWRALGRRWAVRGAMGGFAALTVALLSWVAVSAVAEEPAIESRRLAVVPAAQDPAWAAQQATRTRFEAWRDSDGEKLINWTAAGSDARAEAKQTAEALSSGRMTVDGLSATIDRVTERSVAATEPRVAVVTVAYTLSEHTVTIDGVETRFGAYSQTVDLELVRENAGWRVASAIVNERPA